MSLPNTSELSKDKRHYQILLTSYDYILSALKKPQKRTIFFRDFDPNYLQDNVL